MGKKAGIHLLSLWKWKEKDFLLSYLFTPRIPNPILDQPGKEDLLPVRPPDECGKPVLQ